MNNKDSTMKLFLLTFQGEDHPTEYYFRALNWQDIFDALRDKKFGVWNTLDSLISIQLMGWVDDVLP